MHCALTVPRYQILRALNRLFLYSCSKPEHPPVGDHSYTTGNRSRNLCYDSWSLSHLGYLYPGTTHVMIKLNYQVLHVLQHLYPSPFFHVLQQPYLSYFFLSTLQTPLSRWSFEKGTVGVRTPSLDGRKLEDPSRKGVDTPPLRRDPVPPPTGEGTLRGGPLPPSYRRGPYPSLRQETVPQTKLINANC